MNKVRAQAKNLNYFFIFIFVFTILNTLSVLAGPSRTTYQAKIIKPDGYPLEASNVNFKFTILDPAGSCILYSETYSAVNMSGAGGLISFALGSGVKTYPASATTFENIFSNVTASLSCDTGGPANYSPGASDIRKIVMQFHDGTGWQTLPAMSINAVPYAMYANEAMKLNGLTSSDFVQVSIMPTCTASEALRYTGASFSCVAVGNSVTSSTVVTALGYTPADGASVTALTSNVSSVSSTVASVSSTVFSVSSTVTSLQNSVAASFAAITSSQWTTSGTNIFYNTGNIGIGTTTPVTKLDVSGGVRIGGESTTCAPALAGTLRYNASNVEYCNGTSWQAFGVSGAGITNFNGSTSGTQLFANATGGTAPAFNTSNGVHTLNIPNASTGSVTAGLISNADYTTFTNKITSSAASIAQVLGYVPADNAVSGTYAQKANNLSDLTNVVTARTNLGLGTFATASSIDLGSASATGTLAIARLPSFTGDATIAAASNTIILSNSGVTAGTYTKVTVDTKGRVTSGSQITSSDVTTALGYTPANSATTVSSQWSTSGTTINYMNGNVGIGTTSPSKKLEVQYGEVQVNTGSSSYGFTAAEDSTHYVRMYYDGNNDNGQIRTDNAPLHINTNGSGQPVILNDSNGNVGIGTTTPVTKLDVSGGVRIGLESTTCAPALAGTLRYNASNVEYCNGTSWQAFGVSGAGITNFNGSTSGTQSFATGTGGTAANIVTANGVHTLNIPNASTGSVTAGLISNADYTTFSNKITSSAASIAQVLGYVPADNAASGTYAQKANNLSDLTNIATARTNLGLGTFATASSIDLGSASATGTLAVARLPSFTGDATVAVASNTIILSNSGVTAGTYTKVTVDGKGRVTSSSALASSDVTTALGYTPASATASTQWTTSGSAIYYNTGSVGIGTSNPVSILHLRGAPMATANYGLVSIGNGPFDGSSSGFFTGNANGVVHAINTAAGFTGEFAHYQNGTSDARFIVKSDGSVVSGRGTVNGSLSSSFGGLNTVNGVQAFAVGHFNQSSGNYSFSSGLFSTASGDNSTAMGYAITANSLGMTAIGINNVVPTGTSTNTWQATDPVFVIGNGQGSAPASASTAMTVLKNGNVGIGTTAPTAKLHLASGTTSAAPLKFTSGTLLTSPQSGTMEYDGANFYLTDSTSTRRAIAANTNPGTYDNVSNINSSGNITLTPTGSVVVSSTTASTNSSTGALIVNGGLGVAGNLNVAGTISGSAKVMATGFRANQGVPDSNDSSTNGYAFGTDGDTGMFSPGSGAANGVLAFFGNNAELMRITASGAVGIGTTNPTAPIEAAKNFGASGAANSILKLNARGTASSGFGGSIDFLSSNEIAQNDFIAARISSAWEVADNGFGLSFFTKNTGANGGATVERMRISNSGYVGVGTTTPSEKLEVSGALKIGGIRQILDTGDSQRLFLQSTGANTAHNVAIVPNGTASTGFELFMTDGYADRVNIESLRFLALPGAGEYRIATTQGGTGSLRDISLYQGGTQAMTWDTSGNVGIGTNSPVHPLDVKGWISSHPMSANNSGFQIVTSGTQVAAAGTAGWVIRGNNPSSPYAGNLGGSLSYENWNGVSMIQAMAITSGGNVGIGTATPARKLHIKDQYPYLAFEDTENASGSVGTITYNQDGNFYFDADNPNTGTDSGFRFRANGGTKYLLTVLNSGNVGIGTTSPIAKLDVNDSGTAVDLATIQSIPSGANIGFRYAFRAGMEGASNSNAIAYGGRMRATNLANQYLLYGYRDDNGISTASINGNGDAYFAGSVGVGIASPTAKLDVNGQIAGKSYKTRLFQAGGKSSTSCTLSASNTAMADQFCDLSVTFTLTDPASAQINYTIAMSAGSSGGRHLVTGIDIDGAVVTTVLTGITSQEATPYWSNSQTHFADLATGSHTIKVKYRTPAGGTSNPSANDWENRILQVMILGFQ